MADRRQQLFGGGSAGGNKQAQTSSAGGLQTFGGAAVGNEAANVTRNNDLSHMRSMDAHQSDDISPTGLGSMGGANQAHVNSN